MQNKNSMLTGFFIALIFPGAALAIEFAFSANSYIINKPAVPYFIAMVLNLFIVRHFLKSNADETARGVMLATFTVMLTMLLKGHLIR